MSKEQDIAKAIDELPICADGKDSVKKLIKALGYKVEIQREPKPGEVWKNISPDGQMSQYELIVHGPEDAFTVRLDDRAGQWKNFISGNFGGRNYKFAFNSLAEYYASKN